MAEGYLDTRGKQWLGIATCDRCHRKFPVEELWSDRNNPGLKVCSSDLDDFDPWRLPPRSSDQITLRYARPDIDIATQPRGLLADNNDYFFVTDDFGRYIDL